MVSCAQRKLLSLPPATWQQVSLCFRKRNFWHFEKLFLSERLSICRCYKLHAATDNCRALFKWFVCVKSAYFALRKSVQSEATVAHLQMETNSSNMLMLNRCWFDGLNQCWIHEYKTTPHESWDPLTPFLPPSSSPLFINPFQSASPLLFLHLLMTLCVFCRRCGRVGVSCSPTWSRRTPSWTSWSRNWTRRTTSMEEQRSCRRHWMWVCFYWWSQAKYNIYAIRLTFQRPRQAGGRKCNKGWGVCVCDICKDIKSKIEKEVTNKYQYY